MSKQIEREFDVDAVLEIAGTRDDELEVSIRVYDDSASSYVEYFSTTRAIVNYVSRSDRAVFQLTDRVTLAQNDRVELWVKNLTAARDVTLINGSICKIRAL